MLDDGTTTPPTTLLWILYGVEFIAPLFSTFDVAGMLFGLPPLKKYRLFTRISPPTRSEVSVPGIKKERGKLPPTIPAPAAGDGGPPGYRPPTGEPTAGSCDNWSRRCWRSNALSYPDVSSCLKSNEFRMLTIAPVYSRLTLLL